ncbi:BatA domain-containing protein [Alloacidobacterium dinghuense]|uniref:BatA domain-containing protein n=1 Tax=Alloacidobacterium dinghuense TaxID=2763107 RepID=A0A7G8BFW4_9BACT|nr:BatA domain-containing protein [Alloacidobacterium dinghuense]QNI31434.1 BatA domain-containing protein [Alloacidobacterium dinghuense]
MGFLAPWFLTGLAALGVPVFVHLLRKHVTTPRPVSSLMFFERGIQSSTRHQRLRYLLLFALRSALLLLVVFAFAEPFVRRAATGANEHELLIVLDSSFSMRAGTRFADARQQALALLAAKPPSQKAQVIALGGQIEMLTQPISDEAQLRSALESIQLGDGHANFGELGRTIRAMADTSHRPIDLHLFSDMQRTAMPANFADMMLPPNATLVLHDVAKGTAPPNWTVERVTAPAELADPKDPKRSRVQAVVAGFGTPAAEKTVSLVINGKAVATRNVKIPADGRATVEFAPVDVGYGFNRCEVRLEGGDAFPADDASLFVIRRSDPERVLFVHASNDIRSAVYFGAALAAAGATSFLLQSVTAEQTTDLDPSKFGFVVLSDAGTLPSIFEHTLAQYVAKGGGVLIALGTNAGRRARIPLWGADARDVHDYAHTGAAASVSQVDFTYPALAQEQPGHDNGGWAETKIFYAASVDPGQARVAARLSDGTPLLLDKQSGEGHVLLLTSGLENLTNDLPLHPVFVAFVDKAARYLSGHERLSGSQLVDSFVQLRSATAPVGEVANVEVIDPDGRRPLSLSEARTVQTFRLQRAGFYQVRFANGRDAVIGVNPDRRESDLQPIAQDVLQLWSGNNAGGVPVQAAVVDDVKYRRVNLWWYVMLLALVVALAETALASRYIGTQREEA